MIGGFDSHNPVDSQHEGQIVGGQADGLQNDGDGDDASGWDARCTYARGCGGHPRNDVETITTTGRTCVQKLWPLAEPTGWWRSVRRSAQCCWAARWRRQRCTGKWPRRPCSPWPRWGGWSGWCVCPRHCSPRRTWSSREALPSWWEEHRQSFTFVLRSGVNRKCKVQMLME